MLDLLYAQAAGARRRWYERHPHQRRRLARPVISVGNLSLGGSGKTPLVAAITQWLLERGERPVILSRGYGRRDRRDGVVVVSDGRRVDASVDAAGDEPLMLARKLPGAIVTVADDRFLAGTLAERRFSATIHVLDDGFQHLHLARDLDVLMTTPGEITAGRVVPFGRLREGRDAAARAHLAVVLDTDLAGARAEAWTLGISQAVAARRMLEGSGPAAGAPPVVAIAGIARPDQFFGMLRADGWPLARTIAFADHHRYTAADIARIDAAAREAGTTTVATTEKDAVRLEGQAPLPFDCVAVPLRLVIDDWTTVAASIDQAMVRAREAA